MRKPTFWMMASLILTLSASAQAAPASADGNSDAALDRAIPEMLTSYKVASVSFAVIRSGKIVHVAAFGEQSPGVAATSETLYNIASLTKPLTAEIILRAAATGRIALDESMDPYWSDPDLSADARRALLTPRMALSHQTGLPNWRDQRSGLAFMQDPGTQWSYSGEGYEYVARYAEHKLHEPFERLAQKLLFGPLKLRSTSYTFQTRFKGRIALPTDQAGNTLGAVQPAQYNAADLAYSTPGEYAVFMLDVLADRGLTGAIAQQRDRSQVSMAHQLCIGSKAADCPSLAGFGLGWQILGFDKHMLMMHTGKDDGIFTFAYVDRMTNDGVVIFTNSDNGYKMILPILERVHTLPAFLRFLRSQID